MDDGVDDQDAAAGDIPSDASMAVVLHEGNICGDLPTSNLPIYTIFSCTPLTLPLFFSYDGPFAVDSFAAAKGEES